MVDGPYALSRIDKARRQAVSASWPRCCSKFAMASPSSAGSRSRVATPELFSRIFTARSNCSCAPTVLFFEIQEVAQRDQLRSQLRRVRSLGFLHNRHRALGIIFGRAVFFERLIDFSQLFQRPGHGDILPALGGFHDLQGASVVRSAPADTSSGRTSRGPDRSDRMPDPDCSARARVRALRADLDVQFFCFRVTALRAKQFRGVAPLLRLLGIERADAPAGGDIDSFGKTGRCRGIESGAGFLGRCG